MGWYRLVGVDMGCYGLVWVGMGLLYDGMIVTGLLRGVATD